jgi:hypothetical protein
MVNTAQILHKNILKNLVSCDCIVESIRQATRHKQGDKRKHARQLSQKRAKSKTNVQAGGKKNTATEKFAQVKT